MAYESWQTLIEHLAEIKRLGPSNPRIYRGYLERVPGLFRNLVLFDDTLEDNNGDTHVCKGKRSAIAHYTSWEKTVEILELGVDASFRMYNYELANDPCEGAVHREEWVAIEEQALTLDKVLQKTKASDLPTQGSAYGCSFSSGAIEDVGDNLTFWRLYGNNGDGCSFMMPFKINDMYRVRYYDSVGRNVDGSGSTTHQEVLGLFREVLQVSKELVEEAPKNEVSKITEFLVRNIRRLLSTYQHLAKNDYYRDEREWRMVKVAPARRDVHFDVTDGRLVKRFVNGPPCKDMLVSETVITIGPCVRNRAAAIAYLEDKVKKLGLSAKVAVSNKDYRLV